MGLTGRLGAGRSARGGWMGGFVRTMKRRGEVGVSVGAKWTAAALCHELVAAEVALATRLFEWAGDSPNATQQLC